jgi:hypothetical protein
MGNVRLRLPGLWALIVWASIVGMLLTVGSFSWAQVQSHAVVIKATKHAIAPPLSQFVPVPPRTQWVSSPHDDADARPAALQPRSAAELQHSELQDPVLQSSSQLTALATAPGLNILGVGTGFPGFSIQANIAIANGAAGPTQFVQFVNESFAVFNKTTGSLEYGPADGNTLWQSIGAPCSSNTNLDETAQYDKLAGRWVMMMPVYGSPSTLCIAVSTTSNATSGAWNVYAFEIAPSKLCNGCRLMPDYPKLGVWPDAYYITYNQSYNSVFEGAAACAVNRAAMLSGSAATMQCFLNTPITYGTLLPSDVDGTTAPPSGSPDYFMNFDVNDQSLDLWQFHVNWTTPASSTFTGPTNIPVAAFLEPCGDTVSVFTPADNCVPQSGTSQMLGVFGDRLMYRLAYRNFGTYQDLVVNHSVQVSSGSNQTGIRWYELRNSGAGFGVFQQGTYAPDSSYRWMGSIAMDKVGDIAAGYNVSSSTLSPTIRYTGRLATDPLGTMESEVDLLSAAGAAHTSQTTSPRWGDYSSMAIDPTDDCTFWYTNQYQTTTGSDHWSTQIASFSFPACTGATAVPWTIVNKASSFGSPLTSLTIPPTGSGNLIALAIMFNGNTSVTGVTDSAGNTYVSAGARAVDGALSTEIWYAVNSSPGATTLTPTFAGSPTHVEVSEWEVSGLANTAPDAKATSSGAVTLANTPGPAVTTTQAGDFVVSVLFANSSNFTSITSGNAFTDDFTTFGNGWAHLTSNSASPGTYQASWTTAAPAGIYCASTVAFLGAN